MIVHFIGAGPGAADLITVRGMDIIRAAPVVLYAGSLVPKAIIAEAPADARTLRLSAAGVRRGDVRAALGMRRDFEKNAIAAAVSAAAVVESEGLARYAWSAPGAVGSGL